jgi:hypothetical protein
MTWLEAIFGVVSIASLIIFGKIRTVWKNEASVCLYIASAALASVNLATLLSGMVPCISGMFLAVSDMSAGVFGLSLLICSGQISASFRRSKAVDTVNSK